MTHDEARQKAIEALITENPDIAEIIREGIEGGRDARETVMTMIDRFGVDAAAAYYLAAFNHACRATHPETGKACEEKHPHSGPHAYKVQWYDGV